MQTAEGHGEHGGHVAKLAQGLASKRHLGDQKY